MKPTAETLEAANAPSVANITRDVNAMPAFVAAGSFFARLFR